MWRVLALLLALCAPAQAALHADGFEKRMPVSDWIQLVGPKDGTLKQTISVPLSGGAAGGTIASGTAPMSSGDFPTTPFVITGVEFRIAALASHPGIAVHNVFTSSQWMQSTGSAQFTEAYGDFAIPETAFEVGDSGDLPDADYLAFGGYNAIVNAVELQKPSPVPALSSFPLTQPSWWTSRITITALGEPGSPYERVEDSFAIELASLESYTAELYVDAIEYRLHYEDASTTSMSGSGTMSATLLKAKSMASAMSGSGACAATLNSKRNIYSDMIGTGKITPVISRDDGSAVYRYLMPEMIGTGEVTLTQPIRYGTIRANMVGSGDVVASISHGKNIMAPSRNGTLALRGSGTLAETLRAKRPIATAMAGSGTVSGGPLAKRPIATAMTGTGAVSASMIASRPIATAMTGSGVMSETLRAGRVHPGVAMTGSGAMTLALLAKRPLVAAMQATGLLSADLTINSRLPAPDGRTFVVPESEATFIATDDFLTFEAQE